MLLAACDARIAAGPTNLVLDAAPGSGPDASTQEPPPDAAPLGPWSPPTKITAAAVPGRDDDDETLSSNGLEMIYAITNNKTKDLFYTRRASTKSTDWSAPVKVPFTVDSDQTPRLSADDLILYFSTARNNDNGTLDVWQAKRDAAGANVWQTPTKLTTVDSAVTEKWYMPCPIKGSPDYIMAKDLGDGTTHLVESTDGGAATEITELAGDAGSETGTFLANDCLTIYFASTRNPRAMIYTSHRTAIGAPWAAPRPVVDYPITGVDNDNQEDPWMASDTRTFVFVSNAGGDKDVYISTR